MRLVSWKTIILLGMLATMQISIAAQGRGKLEGVWRMTAFRDGKTTTLRSVSDTARYRKLLTRQHFVWYASDRAGRVHAVTSGTYRLNGNDYSEQIEAAGSGDAYMIGKTLHFHCLLKGKRWEHSGTLPNGMKIDEIWERVE